MGHSGKAMLLTGQYRRSLDDKLRVAVPKPFREALTAAPLYLTPGLDGCLALYPEAEFAALADRLANASPATAPARDYARLFFSQAECLSADKQGRLRLPAELAQWATLQSEIVLVGVRDHLEIWDAAKWDQYVAQRDHSFTDLAEAALGGARPPAESPSMPSAPCPPASESRKLPTAAAQRPAPR